jgi:hypothetical protein
LNNKGQNVSAKILFKGTAAKRRATKRCATKCRLTKRRPTKRRVSKHRVSKRRATKRHSAKMSRFKTSRDKTSPTAEHRVLKNVAFGNLFCERAGPCHADVFLLFFKVRGMARAGTLVRDAHARASRDI